MSPVSNAVLTRNVTALAEAGAPVPADVLRTPEDVDLLHHRGEVVGVALRTPTGPVPMQAPSYPAREAEGWIAEAALSSSTVAVVGAGAGHVIEALERRGYRGRILVLEPSPGSCVATLARHDWRALIKARRLRWLVGPAYDGWTDAWSWITPGEAPGVVIHPVLGQARSQDVRAALAVLKKLVFNAGANERARRQFAGPYLLNTLHNLPHLLRSHDVRDVAGRFAGVPVVVAAAGPSLNRNLEELAPVRDRALLVAVDTALSPCLAAGLEPDFVVAVDPGALNLRHLAIGTAPSRTWLVGEPSLAPGAFDAFGDRILTFRVSEHEPWPWLREQGIERGVLRAWGSVLTTALDLAVHLGCDPIVLIGADFGYTNGQPYCRGTAYEEDWARELPEYGSLEAVWAARWHVAATAEEIGLNGEPVRATPQLLAFRDWIADYCRQQCGVQILNATGGGLLRTVAAADVRDVLDGLPSLRLDMAPPSGSSVRRLAVPVGGWGFDEEAPQPWATWAAIGERSWLELIGMVSHALEDSAWDALASAYSERRLRDAIAAGSLPESHSAARTSSPAARPANQAQSVQQWKRLHAAGYLSTHPVLSDTGDARGLAQATRLLALAPHDVLLDVGCGYGRLLRPLAGAVAHAIGLDIAPEPLRAAREFLRTCNNVTLVQGNGLSLHPVADQSVSAIVSVAVLQHLPRLAVIDYLEEFVRVLRPGGRACLQFFTDGSSTGDVLNVPGEQSISYSSVQLCVGIERAGLRVRLLERESLDLTYPGRDLAWWWVVCDRPVHGPS